MKEIMLGKIIKGNLKILNKESETNAVCESRTLVGSERTYVANVTKDT